VPSFPSLPDLLAVFERQVWPTYRPPRNTPAGSNAGSGRTGGVDGRPVLVVSGGQPGAGKTPLLATASTVIKRQQGHCVFVSGDDLRCFVPGYVEASASGDPQAAARTDEASGQLAGMLVKRLLAQGHSLVVEGTMRIPAVAQATLLDAGSRYRRFAVVMQVHPLFSQLGIYERYLRQMLETGSARFSTRQVHCDTLDGMPKTLTMIYQTGLCDEIFLCERGSIVAMKTIPGQPPDPVQALVRAWQRPLTPAELVDLRLRTREAVQAAALLALAPSIRQELTDFAAHVELMHHSKSATGMAAGNSLLYPPWLRPL
jgi:Zeta toxin